LKIFLSCIIILLILVTTADGAYVIYHAATGGGGGVGDGASRYAPLCRVRIETNEAICQSIIRNVGTFSFGGCYIAQNDVSSASTIALRVNGVNSALSISITGNTTGSFVDEVNSVAVSAGQLVNWIITVPAVAGAHTILYTAAFCRFLATTDTSQRLDSMNTAGATYGSTTLNYIAHAAATDFGTTEANVQHTYRSAGTLKNGYAYLSANTRNSTTTITSRIGGANGNIAVSITASTTGAFEDLVGSDTISAGNLVNLAILGTTGTGSGTFHLIGIDFQTTNSKSHSYMTRNAASTLTAATTYFFGITGGSIGNPATSTQEVRMQYKAGFTCTVSNLKIYLTTNAATGAGTFDFRIGEVSQTQTISITASTTGLFEDTINSDAVAVGNLITYRVVAGSGGDSATSQVGCMIEDTTGAAFTTSQAFIID